jgi:hypothetical protein
MRNGGQLTQSSRAEYGFSWPDQVFAIAALASTPPELVLRDVTQGGHLGLFMGQLALREHWPPLLAEALRHSTSQARRQVPVTAPRARQP